MKNIFLAVAAVVVVSAAGFTTPAAALSCAQPVVDEETIQNASAIFEGVVTAERKMVGGEQDEDVVQKLDATATYTFQVTRPWKGVAKGSVVQVARNTYWGDGFAMGQPYLVFGTHPKEGEPLTAELCGPTVPLQYAEGYKAALAQFFEDRPKTETAIPAPPQDAPAQ